MKKVFNAILFFPSVIKLKIFYLTIITLTASVFEGFSVASFYPILDFIVRVVEKGESFDALEQSSRMWFAIGKVFGALSIPKNLIGLILITYCLLLVRQLINYIKTTYSAFMSENINADIRNLGFSSFASTKYDFYDSHNVGTLVNVLTTDGARAGAGIFTFFNLLGTSAIFINYFIILLLISVKMTMLSLLIMALVALILRSRITISEKIGNRISKDNENILSSIVERLNGIRLIKLTATEYTEKQRVIDISEKIRKNSYSISKIKATIEAVVDPIVAAAGLISLYFSFAVLQMQLSNAVFFIFILFRLLPFTKEIFSSRQTLAGFKGSLFRVKDLLESAGKQKDYSGGRITTLTLKQGIVFEDVSFHYDGNNESALKNISLHFPAGTMTAVVGKSGAGKSTLVDLIPRLRVPTKGSIIIDGFRIEEYDLDMLRRSIAFVSQDGFLFNTTISNNIRYGRVEATPEEVKAASRKAYADPFIEELSNGYETIIGEKGIKLSGGQRQRIILARALLQNSQIIILDEPTSSLDSESEQYIQKAMGEIKIRRNIITIIIAHRLSTIKNADQIIVLDKGRIVECGSHADLMKNGTWYSNMVKVQASV